MAEYEKSCRARRAIKIQMSSILSRIEGNLKESPITKETLDLAEAELGVLLEVNSQLQDLQSKIFDLFDAFEDEPRKKAEQEWLAINDWVFRAIAKARGTIASKRCSLSDQVSRNSLLNTTGSNDSESLNPISQIKLPKIDVPKFDGDIRKFIEFRSLFENLVHSNPSLSNVQKLYFLKNSLTGSAEEIVRDFAISDSAYVEAWSAFILRYDNRKRIVRTLLKDLFELQKIKNEANIRSLLDAVSRIIRGLKVAGEKPDEWSVITGYWLWSRMDDTTRRDFEIRHPETDKVPVFKTVYEFLLHRSAAVEDEKPNFESPSKGRISNESTKNRSQESSKKSMSAAKSSDPKCYLCSDTHYLAECDEFLERKPYERYLVCKDKRLCLLCFGSRHSASECKAKRCQECDLPHHQLLHRFSSEKVDSVVSDN